MIAHIFKDKHKVTEDINSLNLLDAFYIIKIILVEIMEAVPIVITDQDKEKKLRLHCLSKTPLRHFSR